MSNSDKTQIGSSGNSVVNLQKALLAMGFNPGRVDGIFGDKTNSAVKAFQKAVGLTVNGEVDGKTWEVIHKITWTDTPEPITLEVNPKNPYQRHLLSCVEDAKAEWH